MTNLVAVEPATIRQSTDGGLIPADIDQAWRIAQAVATSGIAPRDYNNKPEAALVAIMHGLEIGLKPMQAIQGMAVINGKPSLYGDAIVAVVRGSGLCRYIKETHEGEGDARVAWCETHRAGEPEPTRQAFGVQDAKKANLWGKSGPWTQYPDRMLRMRARAFCLRDVYADVLDGISVREEVEDYNVTPTGGPAITIVDDPAPLPLPKSKARDLYTELQQDIDGADSEDALMVFGAERSDDLNSLPADWKRELRVRYKSRLDDLRAEATQTEDEDLDRAPF